MRNPPKKTKRKTGVYFFSSAHTPLSCPLFPKTNLPGHDIESLLAASPEHCQTLCSAHPQFFVFLGFSGTIFKCYLKNNMAEMVAKAEEGVTSGLPTHFCQLVNSTYHIPNLFHPNYWNHLTNMTSSLLTECAMKTLEGINLPGSDLRFLLVNNAKACQKTCTEDPNCQFYTYTIMLLLMLFHSSRRCYLKRVITMPAPPKVTKLANAVSGFSLRNCHY
uniref:Apple domain-containing protein n=1 Tax=Lates calcarifer TaxID=8187 RepID=A0A4W6FZ67_LATCA